uniref:ARF-like 2-binding protein n=1 Tax=Macrostomum lignano TaxID=282301 RepID=A0A1I8JH65_9PLAT
MLFTITDFVAFKEAMLDYKRAATGEAVDVSMDLVVVPLTPRDAEMTSPSASLSLARYRFN